LVGVDFSVRKSNSAGFVNRVLKTSEGDHESITLVGVVGDKLLVSHGRLEVDRTTNECVNVLLLLTENLGSTSRLDGKLNVSERQPLRTLVKMHHHPTVLADGKAELVEVPVDFDSVTVL